MGSLKEIDYIGLLDISLLVLQVGARPDEGP